MKNYNTTENPEFLNEYLVYLKIVKLLSERTISEYYLDTKMFLKFIHQKPDTSNKFMINNYK